MEQAAPVVSVIVPAYNVAAYIRETLDSVLAQSFADWEAIVVNDGSPDGAALEAVLASYSDRRVKYLRKSNGGPASARNAGIAIARAPWVAFLDGDDVWLPDYLSSQLALLEREQDAAAAFPDGFIFGDTPAAGKRLSEIEQSRPGPITLRDVLSGRSHLQYCCMVRRAALERVGGFDESIAIKASEDHDFYLRLLLAGERIVANPEPLFRYRRRRESLAADRAKLARAALAVVEKISPQLDPWPDLAKLAQQRCNSLRATIEFALGREAFLERRWPAAEDHWRAHQRLRPSWKVAAALGLGRISPRLMFALDTLSRRLRGSEAAQ